MARIQVDQQLVEVTEGKNLLEACLQLGFDLPYFCWHPALGSVGACRQCAVKQFKDEPDQMDRVGKIVMACTTPVKDGMRISIDDPEVRQFRASVIEWLMVNHPHDCPVCDEGGECHLQDMTVMTGHTYRSYRFNKRTFQNQDLGPLINHEMNRCIACYRCVRFYRDYAGGRDLNVFGAHDHVYFGRHEDGTLENEFSGNLVEICPTGVFTDKTLKTHYTRSWDLQTAPSVCVHCSLGCNTIPGERYGSLRRIRNRYHEEINGYFLCDRGRYSYEFVNAESRIRDLWCRTDKNGVATKTTPVDVIAQLGAGLSTPGAIEKTIGIGSPRACLEANFALRELVGAEHFYAGLSDIDLRLATLTLQILREGSTPAASLHDVEQADAVLVLGEDVTQSAPRLALSIRQCRQNVLVATPYKTKLDEIAAHAYRAAPNDIARLGFAVAHALSADSPPVLDLTNDTTSLVDTIVQVLLHAEHPVVVTGTAIRSAAILEAAANLTHALAQRNPNTRLCMSGTEVNTFGVALVGGQPLSEAFQAVSAGHVDTVIVLENDLFRRANGEAVRSFLSSAKRVVLVDHTSTAMVPRADVILPVTTFAEGTGSYVNNEARAQRSYQVFVPTDPIRDSWRWLRDLAIAAGRSDVHTWQNIDDVASALAKSIPAFKTLQQLAPAASFRIEGNRIPRQPHRYSGRTAMVADVTMHEPKPPIDHDSPLAFSMEGFDGVPPPSLISRYWAPGWNSVQALTKFQSEIGGRLPGGPVGTHLITHVSWVDYFRDVPPPFTRRVDSWLAIPTHYIFGSDELSRLAPAIAALAPKASITINAEDASRLGIKDGAHLDLTFDRGGTLSLPVKIEESLPSGLIGVPVGMREFNGIDTNLPGWCTLANTLPGAAR